jgi:hypothetical protein
MNNICNIYDRMFPFILAEIKGIYDDGDKVVLSEIQGTEVVHTS